MLAMGDSAPRKGADAMTFVGCALHTRMQQVAVLDTGTGEESGCDRRVLCGVAWTSDDRD